MIDLHCHLLPGIDDGARDLSTALAMARIAVDDGITLTACTPHIYPGLYANTGPQIREAVERLRQELAAAGIPLTLTHGADIQIVPELLSGLRSGLMPTLHGSRYFLFEPPHHTVPVGFSSLVFDVVASGYVPVITHPERLTWLDDEHFGWFVEAVRGGAWIQVTAGALTGRFGSRARYWGERMLDTGMVHLIATDAHETQHRPPLLSEGRAAAEHWVGAEEAERLVTARPRAIIDNLDPSAVSPPPAPGRGQRGKARKKGWLSALFSAD